MVCHALKPPTLGIGPDPKSHLGLYKPVASWNPVPAIARDWSRWTDLGQHPCGSRVCPKPKSCAPLSYFTSRSCRSQGTPVSLLQCTSQQRRPARRAAALAAAAAEKSVLEAAVKTIEANVDLNAEKEVQPQVSATGTGKAARPLQPSHHDDYHYQ